MTPLQRYRHDLARDGFYQDPLQGQAVELLQVLYQALETSAGQADSFVKRLLNFHPPLLPGVYLWGGPGRGKTYLMDCFFESLSLQAKRRVHFHRFMLSVHEALDALPKTPDPLKVIAEGLAQSCRVLCLDEFHVTDVADAMLLAGLLEALFQRRVVLVATSNTSPDELYLDGLQRGRFLPAIDLIKSHTRVFELAAKQDFRLVHLRHNGTYQVVDECQAEPWLMSRMQELAPLQQRINTGLRLAGRMLAVRAVAEDVVWVHFDELCQQPRSTRDYLELAREFHTLLLQGVPHLSEELDEAARRFIHLVDALYDHNVKLIVSAASAPGLLYTGRRLQRVFQRTASRLTEMSGEAYLSRPHHSD